MSKKRETKGGLLEATQAAWSDRATIGFGTYCELIRGDQASDARRLVSAAHDLNRTLPDVERDFQILADVKRLETALSGKSELEKQCDQASSESERFDFSAPKFLNFHPETYHKAKLAEANVIRRRLEKLRDDEQTLFTLKAKHVELLSGVAPEPEPAPETYQERAQKSGWATTVTH